MTYLECLVFEPDADQFLVTMLILFVACELKREQINVEVDSRVYFLEFPVHS